MPHAPKFLLLAGACFAILPAGAARAQFGSMAMGRAETVYVDQTFMSPTAYVYPTTYVTPTAYSLSPTAYYDSAPVSYLAPAYAETRYYTPRRYRYRYRPVLTTTRYYEDSYSPTVYYAPTAATIAYPTVAAVGSVCDQPATVTNGRTETDPAPAPTSKRETTAAPAAPRTAPRITSVPKETEPPLQDKAQEKTVDPDPNTPPSPDPVLPLKPAEEPLPEKIPLPGQEDGAKAPRVVQRPAISNSAVLRGEVVSGTTRELQPGVTVQVVNRTAPAKFLTLSCLTDADGHFAIRVPDGEWSVRVAQAGGTFRSKDFTVNAGKLSANKADFDGLILER